MKKYVVPHMTPAHSQTVIRALVNANVVLKQKTDKQTEEKNSMRKKLLQMEREQMDREKSLAAKQKECDELREKLKRMHEQEDHENNKSEERLINAAIAFKSGLSSPSKVLTSTPKSTFCLTRSKIGPLDRFSVICIGFLFNWS